MADVIMPKMGESITEGTILTWHKKPGDKIEVDETIVEVSTDKVDTEIPSPESGTITELLFSEGDVVEVGKVIAKIDTGSNGTKTGNIPLHCCWQGLGQAWYVTAVSSKDAVGGSGSHINGASTIAVENTV